MLLLPIRFNCVCEQQTYWLEFEFTFILRTHTHTKFAIQISAVIYQMNKTCARDDEEKKYTYSNMREATSSLQFGRK